MDIMTPRGACEGLPLFLAKDGLVGDSIVDGPGLRCTLFVQGCPHACPGCHNPATHPFEGGRQVCCEELYREIQKYPLCRGVTFSGGEPLCQAEGLLPLAQKLRAAGYELAAYTGFTYEYLVEKGTDAQKHLLQTLDVLIDGPFVLEKRNLSLRFRGSENQRILNVPRSFEKGEAVWETAPRWVGEG